MRRPNRLTQALVILGLSALSACHSEQATEPSLPALEDTPAIALVSGGSSNSGHQTGLAGCDRQRYAIASQVIGPNGGKLKVGRHEFEIPRGALSSRVRITMEAVADTVHSVRFSPEGLTFKAGHLPKLRLDYHGCRIPQTVRKSVAYVSEALQILQILRTSDNSNTSRLEASLSHFSRFAVAW